MNKFSRNFKKTISSLMILMMIITLIPLNVLAEGKIEGVNVWIRIEGHDKSLVEYRELNVPVSDISYVDGLEELKAEKPLAIHAIVKALEEAGIDVKDPEVFSVAGGFINVIADYSGETSAWMYNVNGVPAEVGVTAYELKEDDVLELYFVDWSNYYFGKLESTSERVNPGEELTLTFTAKKEEWNVDHSYEPVEGGIVKIKGEDKEYISDEKGQVKITFEKPGTYTLLADKQLENGTIVRPRPLTINVKAEEKDTELDINKSINKALNWLLEKDEIDEWAVMDLARREREIPDSYLKEFRKEIQDNKGQFKYVTDYAKYSIVASSLGLDATNLFGYNLIEKIYNHENIFAQGNNGGVFALLALDSKNYHIPEDAKWTRENIVKELLDGQKEDGGFAYTNSMASDIDMTGMTLQALSNYQDKEEVKIAIEKALDYLSENQEKDGGFKNDWVGDSSESVAQVILALTSLDINPLEDERFVKDSNLVEKLLSFQLEDGGFGNKKEDGSSAFSTEQALRGLISYDRFVNGDFKFFHMKDAKLVEFPKEEKPKESFSDIDKASKWAVPYIEKVKELELMEGIGNNVFAPRKNMTRAEFATLLTNLLKLERTNEVKEVFTDVKPGAWYYDSVMKAYEKGIIKGIGNNKFAPKDLISREEMAVMLTRALELDKEVEKQEIKDIDKASHWAIDSINLVYQLGIMKGSNNQFDPKGKVTREMAATIVVRVYELH